MYISILKAVTSIQFNYFLPVALNWRTSKSGVASHKLNCFPPVEESEFRNKGLQSADNVRREWRTLGWAPRALGLGLDLWLQICYALSQYLCLFIIKYRTDNRKTFLALKGCIIQLWWQYPGIVTLEEFWSTKGKVIWRVHQLLIVTLGNRINISELCFPPV